MSEQSVTVAGGAVTVADLGQRFLRAKQARDDAERAVDAARAAFDGRLAEYTAARGAFARELAGRCGLGADVLSGVATVLFGGRVLRVEKSTAEYGCEPAFYVEVLPAVEVRADLPAEAA